MSASFDARMSGVGCPTNDVIDLVLVGGPADLPLTERIRRVAQLDEKIKIEHRGGYEHFVRTGITYGDGRMVYEWVTRTRIAE